MPKAGETVAWWRLKRLKDAPPVVVEPPREVVAPAPPRDPQLRQCRCLRWFQPTSKRQRHCSPQCGRNQATWDYNRRKGRRR